MKIPFSFTLEGRDWSRLYYWYWGPSLLLLLLSMAVPEPKGTDLAANLGPLLISLAISFLSMLVQSFFTVPILKTWLPRLSVEGKSFSFGGDTNAYLMLNVRGFLLSVVSLGIYLPWYTRDVLDYLARETSFEGESARFTGKPVRLLLIILGFFALLVVLAVGLIGALVGNMAVSGARVPSLQALIPVFLVAIAVMAPFLYLVYAWMVQFSWKGLKIRWTTQVLPASAVVLGQLVLTLLSLGLWWPGATLVLYRYFARHTVVEDEAGAVVRFDFEGAIREGWGYLWVQSLLTLVTLGFYGAWSGPNVTRWIASRTTVEARPFEGTTEEQAVSGPAIP